MRVLIDADLLLELLLNRGEVSKEADEVWKLAESRQIEGFITNSGLSKIYFICQELTDEKSVDEIFISLEKTISICSINRDIVKKACLSKLKDFESAIEYTCAKHMGFDGVVTHSLEKFSVSDFKVNVWSVDALLERCKTAELEDKKYRLIESKKIQYGSFDLLESDGLDSACKNGKEEGNIDKLGISREQKTIKFINLKYCLRKINKINLVIVIIGLITCSMGFEDIFIQKQRMNFINKKDVSKPSEKTEFNYCHDKLLLNEKSVNKKDVFSFRCFADVPHTSSLKRVVYADSKTWLKLQNEIEKEIHKNFLDINLINWDFKNQELSSGEAIKLLLNGQLSFVGSSRPLSKNEYQEGIERGYELKEIPVAIDEIGIFVHSKFDSKGLTINQLRDIYTGKLTNWSQVGGPNERIVPYSHPINSETTKFFQKNILKIDDFGNNVKYIKTNREAINKITETSNQKETGIYFSSYFDMAQHCQVKPLPIFNHVFNIFVLPYKGSMVLRDRCLFDKNKINTNEREKGFYPIVRQLFLVIKKDNSVDQEAGETYAKLLLSDEGQNIVEKVGLRPIHF
jgi:ABC-type phosphate transport system substrate-binding protein